MDASTVHALICELFLGGHTDAGLRFDTPLLAAGICDSLGLVQIASELERRCPGLRILDQEITRENFGSVAQIAGFLRSKLGS